MIQRDQYCDFGMLKFRCDSVPLNLVMPKPIIVAIDGFSSCGKSTVAKQLAKQLSYIFIDSGAMYRAVTLYFIRHQVDLQNNEAVENALKNIHIHFEYTSEGLPATFLNNENVEASIRQMEISQMVSPVSALKPVRIAMVKQQQRMGEKKGIVMDGRDIGTTVFPDAELKIFLTAHPLIRAQRRLLEYRQKGEEMDLDTVLQNLAERDRIDSTRAESPLRKAEDAIEIDNSNLDRDQQLHLISELVEMAKEGQFSQGRKQLAVERYLCVHSKKFNL